MEKWMNGKNFINQNNKIRLAQAIARHSVLLQTRNGLLFLRMLFICRYSFTLVTLKKVFKKIVSHYLLIPTNSSACCSVAKAQTTPQIIFWSIHQTKSFN